MIGREFFSAMRPGSIFVNTSRGGVIDETAFLAAFNNGVFGGAALDVLSGEDRLLAGSPHPVIEMARRDPKLIVTPHIAGASEDSMRATEIFIARKLSAVLSALV